MEAVISGCAQKPEKIPGTPETGPVPANTTTPAPRGPVLSLEEVKPVKMQEKIPEKFLPALLPWKLFKGGKESSMYYPSFIPRKRDVKFSVNVSSHFGFFTSTPLVEGETIYLADDAGVVALSKDASYSGRKM